jgi:gliding motility-associated-like protein
MIQFYQRNFYKIFFLLLILMRDDFSFAQPCSAGITTFPYNESFETGDGNWIAGGTASDWMYGAPVKNVITAAASGNTCWITGGLTNNFYNSSENSWLQSPCFNFAALQYPQISFKIFWETERKFDGASFQYSIDGGNNWSYPGINGSNNCEGENWFNTASINYLSNASGWSGNIQPDNGSCLGGGGSGGWLTARHSLSALAGQTNVLFRFLFASGSTCNDYNGFAVDDIVISEAPENTASFNNTCISEKEISFTPVADCATAYSWQFGDFASGDSNTAIGANATHVFYKPGTYNVALTSSFKNGAPVVTIKEVVIIGLNPVTDWPGRCVDIYNATLSVVANGSNAPYAYTWNTDPVQTSAAISNVQPGNYLVTVSSINACDASANFIIEDSQQLHSSFDIKNATCSAKDGSIKVTVTGGNPPFNYLWSDGSRQSSLKNINAGSYELEVTDAANCFIKTVNIMVSTDKNILPVDLGADIGICSGEFVLLSPGAFISYRWQDGSALSNYTVTTPGTYYVNVANAQGCTGSDTVQVTLDCSKIYFPSAFTPDDDNKNDAFGPYGNLSAIKKYTLSVYNRFGQLIFKTNDPFKKWDGTFKGNKMSGGTLVWMAGYEFNGRQKFAKGTITIVR